MSLTVGQITLGFCGLMNPPYRVLHLFKSPE
jgi:hypothetical protein